MKYFVSLMALMIISFGLHAQKSTKNTDERSQRKEKLESLKIAYITTALELTSEESIAFWPVYNKFKSDMDKSRKRVNLRQKSESIDSYTDEESRELIMELLEAQELELELKKQMFSDIEPIIGAKKVLKLIVAEKEFRKKLYDKHSKNKR